jgi:hypothetical protein
MFATYFWAVVIVALFAWLIFGVTKKAYSKKWDRPDE